MMAPTFGGEDEHLTQGKAGLHSDHLNEDKASLDRVCTWQVFAAAVIQGPREPGTQSIPGHAGRVTHPDLQVMEGRVATASTGQDADHLDVIGLQEVHHPPGTGFILGLGAVLVLMQDRGVTVVPVPGIPAADRRGLIRRLAVRNVHGCRVCINIICAQLGKGLRSCCAAYLMARSSDSICLLHGTVPWKRMQ